ncbi:MAG: hypothetical protein ACRDPT_02175, partial [Streptomycetales bacterium]
MADTIRSLTAPASDQRGVADSGSTTDPAGHPRRRSGLIPVLVWGALIAAAFGWGQWLKQAGALPIDGLPPLHAHLRSPSAWLLPVAGLGALAVALLPAAVAATRWSRQY